MKTKERPTIPSGAKVIHRFTVLHKAWECDSEGRVCEYEGQRFLVLTSHGSPYRADPKELHEKIAEYQGVIAETVAALDALK